MASLLYYDMPDDVDASALREYQDYQTARDALPSLLYSGGTAGMALAPSSGVADVLGYLPSGVEGETFPSFGQNLYRGNFGDAGLQLMSLGGDAFYAVSPLTGGLSAIPAAALKTPRAAKVASNASKRATKFESNGYSNIKRDTPIEDVQRIIEPAYDVKPFDIRPIEGLLGKPIIPFVADKSDAGVYLRGIDDMVFDEAVLLDGGRKFMAGRQAQADDAVWASGSGITSGLNNAALKAAEETGEDVYGAYLTMSPKGIDFSSMMLDATLEAVKLSPIKSADMKAVDDAVRNFTVKNQKGEVSKPLADWVGFDSPKAREYAMNLSGKNRVALLNVIDKNAANKVGFPDMGAIRYAITDPELTDVGAYRGGMAFGKLDPQAGMIENPTFPHGTYESQMKGGGDVFRLQQDIPMGLLFPDRLNEPRFQAALPQNRMGSLRDSPYGQVVTEQMVENIENYFKTGLLD